MTYRKKKLIIIQSFLLIFGLAIIIFTYTNIDDKFEEQIISKETEKKIEKQLSQQSDNLDTFYNIQYSGIDLSGNRYILSSKEAFASRKNSQIINMKGVEATFYFKNDPTLKVFSNNGIYNNKTLDITFIDNIEATYNISKLFAGRAEYSNQKGSITISKNVTIEDERGKMFADKLFFDIKKQKLDIFSVNSKKVNTKINLK